MEKKSRGILAASAVFLAAAFMLAYSFLPMFAPPLQNSPDEAMNSFYSRLFAKSGQLWLPEALNLFAPGLVHPRATRVIDLLIVPGGFIGLPVLYGLIAKAFGLGVIPYLTPAIAVLGAFAFGALASHLWSRRVGVFSTVLLLGNPAWWYVASRTLMPNALFASLLAIGLWFFLAAPLATALRRTGYKGTFMLSYLDPIIAGGAIGFAIAVRASEAYWLIPTGIAVAAVSWKDLPRRSSVVALAAAAFALAPFLFLQKIVFGSYFSSGYGPVSTVASLAAGGGFGSKLLGPLRAVLFPLGFAPRTAIVQFWRIAVVPFAWWWVAVAIAHAYLLRLMQKKSIPISTASKRVAVAAAVSAIWLIAFYGSYIMPDDSGVATIGSSYLRYWLPMFALSTLPLALAADVLWQRASSLAVKGLCIAATCALVLMSGYAVAASPGDGLLAIRATQLRNVGVLREILAATPQQSLIVADRADKMLFPFRSVMTPLRSAATYDALPKLVPHTSVYYYGITLPPTDFSYLRDKIFAPRGLGVRLVKTIDAESLYAITKASASVQ